MRFAFFFVAMYLLVPPGVCVCHCAEAFTEEESHIPDEHAPQCPADEETSFDRLPTDIPTDVPFDWSFHEAIPPAVFASPSRRVDEISPTSAPPPPLYITHQSLLI